MLVLCAGSGGCGDGGSGAGSSDPAAFRNDPRAVTVEDIRHRFSNGRTIPVQEVDLLLELSHAYPEETSVNDILERILVQREDWNALVRLRSRKPATERTGAEKADLAKLLVKAQRFDEAAALLDQAIAELPEEIEYRWFRGYASYYAGDYAGAIQTFEEFRAPLLAAGHTQSILLTGLSYLQLARVDPPGTAGRASDGTPPEPLERAIAELTEFVRREPDNLSGCNGLARALVAAGREREAAPLLARVDELHRQQNRAERQQARLAAQGRALSQALSAGRLDEGERIIKEILPDTDGELRARLLSMLGDIYASTGRPEEARQVRDRAAGRDPLGGEGMD
jgi:tetratricopeptide (TPR) repeat protein